MNDSLDARFRAALGTEQGISTLLARMGFSGSGCLGSWDDIVLLDPSRELPAMLAADLGAPSQQPERIAEFVEAHQLAVLHGFLADRIDDGQATPEPDLLALRPVLREAWVGGLARAIRDETAARRWIETAERFSRAAVSGERHAFARHSLTVDRYARLSLARLWWAGLATHALLQVFGTEVHQRSFHCLFGVLVSTLQCLDDAFDVEEDRRIRGAAASDLLGMPPQGLARAAGLLGRRGEALARQAGFAKLGDWFRGRAEEVDRSIGTTPGFQAELSGLALADAMEARAAMAPRFPRLRRTPLSVETRCERRRIA